MILVNAILLYVYATGSIMAICALQNRFIIKKFNRTAHGN